MLANYTVNYALSMTVVIVRLISKNNNQLASYHYVELILLVGVLLHCNVSIIDHIKKEKDSLIVQNVPRHVKIILPYHDKRT